MAGVEELYFNGINGDSGEYDLPPMTASKLYSFLTKESPPENLNELRYRNQQASALHLGVREAVDSKSLSESGWGIIFAADADPAVKEALNPLLNLREAQTIPLFKIYDGVDGFRPKESKSKFLAKHGAGPGPADPTVMPYYLLIVGSPEEIPYPFQTQLDVQYAVGRIHFDTLDEYDTYARSVVAAETGQVKRPRQATFFAPAIDDDRATQLSCNILAKPLYNTFQQEEGVNWTVNAFLEGEATKSQLSNLLGGNQTPALLFSASHGMVFPYGSGRQLDHQGALLCQDWPGPEAWAGTIPPEHFFSGDDLTQDTNLLGLIAFFFASFSGGTPLYDEFSKLISPDPKPRAPKPFVAQLPAKMLGHRNGGALAVIAQVDQALGYSNLWPGVGAQTAVYESVIRRLLDGHPVGSAVEFFDERYAELSTVLSDLIEEVEFGRKVDPHELFRIWTANGDAKGYTVIGDPAVRLPVSEEEEELARPTITVEPVSSFEIFAGSFSLIPNIEDDRELPEFVVKIRSQDEETRQEGIGKALQIAQQAILIFDQAAEQAKSEGKTKLEFSLEDEKILDLDSELKKEIRRQVRIIESPQATGRQDALSILTKLGPIAKAGALPAFKKIVTTDPDVGFRTAVVPAIVATEKDRPELLGEFGKLLRDGDPAVRLAVMEALVDLDPPARELKNDLWRLSSDTHLGAVALETLFAIESDKSGLISNVLVRQREGKLENREARAILGDLFLGEANALGEAWAASKENKPLLLDLLVATLSEGDSESRQAATAWLIQRVDEVPGELIEKSISDLKQLYLAGDDAELQGEIIALSEKLSERKKVERILLLRNLRSSDSAVQIEAIKRATETENEWALRILIQEWVQWIASGRSEMTQLVEEAAEKMRHNAMAVLPLVNHLTQEFQPSDEILLAASSASEELSQREREQNGSSASDNDKEILKKRIDELLKEELGTRDWNIHQRILKQLNDSKKSDLDEEAKRELIIALIETEFTERELRVHQRIARQLADMSNPNYYEDGPEDEEYKGIKKSLEKYGVPVLARLLPEAADDEIRKNLAYTLGNVGSRESVDALARAVVGEERTRANRQKLLAEYYLDPSKRRSDEAADILKGAVSEARRTLRLLQWLNGVLFLVGLIILVGGLIVAAISEENATRVAGILVGLGGFAGVVYQLVKDPLDRIQNAMANLVQLETAFTSFIWELNLNGTYIQSQYVAEGILTNDDIGETIGRIEDAMNLTMDQVAIYTDRGRQDLIPHITSLSPVVGEHGSTISIFGRHLKRENGNRKNKQQIAIAINHVPIPGKDQSKDRNVVKFDLPGKLPSALNTENGAIWVSLIIEGQETNPLPFQLVKPSDNDS